MTVSAATFIQEYPEFQALHTEDQPLIVAVLARAERRIASDFTPARRDDAVMLQAADTLARGPWGRNARLSELGTPKDPAKPTIYAADLADLKKAYAFARSRVV